MPSPFGAGIRQWARSTTARLAASSEVLGAGELLVDELGAIYGGDGVTVRSEMVRMARLNDLPSALTPAQFGAKGDDSHNDTSALQALFDAAEAQGRAVNLGSGIYRIHGPITQGNISVFGDGGNESEICVIRCMTNTASYSFGYPSGGDHYHPNILSGLVIDMNGTGDPNGRLQMTAVKANVNRVTVTNLASTGNHVADMCAGDAVWLNGCQNSIFMGFDANAVQGAALVMDNGAGGCSFIRCEISTANILLRITDNSPGTPNGGGYPFGPANNYFHDCIFETRLEDSYTLVSIETGSMNIFYDCGFSVSTNTAVLGSGTLVSVTNDILYKGFTSPFSTSCSFQGGNWNGGQAGGSAGSNPVSLITVEGFNVVTIGGSHYYQDCKDFVHIKGNAPSIQYRPSVLLSGSQIGPAIALDAALSDAKQAITFGTGTTSSTVTFGANTTAAIQPTDTAASVQTKLRGLASIGAGNVTVQGGSGAPFLVRFTGSKAGAAQALMTTTPVGGTCTVTSVQTGGTAASLGNAFNKEIIQTIYKLSASNPIGIAMGHDDEGLARIWIQRSGAIAFGDATAVPSVGFAYDSTNKATSTSGQFRVNSGRSEGHHLTTVSSGAFSFTADTTAYPGIVFSYVNAACALTTFLLNGATPVDGQLFTITHVMPTPGGCTYVWPPNVAFHGPTPTENAAGTVLSVTFRYNAADTTWHEVSRSGNRQPDLPNYIP